MSGVDRIGATIVVDGVTKNFREVTALDSISLTFPSGTTALLGRNGAGKTTLINLIAGVVLPNTGSIRAAGHPVGTPEAVSLIARQIELPGNAGFLTSGRLRRIFGLDDEETERLHGLLEHLAVPHRPFGKMSTGNQVKFALSLAFARNRTILLLDEPTAGLDIFGVEILNRLISERRDAGQTTLVATHQPTLTPELFDRAVVIEGGRLLYDGNLDRLLASAPGAGEAATTRLALAMARLIEGSTP